MSAPGGASFERLEHVEREDSEEPPTAAQPAGEDCGTRAHGGDVPAPAWFDPEKPQGDAGRALAKFRQLPAWAHGLVYAVMAVGGGAFSLLFLLSARCEAKCDRTHSPAIAFWCAAAGNAAFWVLAIVTCYLGARPGLLTWDSELDDNPTRRPLRRTHSRISLMLDAQELHAQTKLVQGGVVQTLAFGVNISPSLDTKLQRWLRACDAIHFGTCAYFVASAVVCIELLVSDRNQPDELSWLGREFAGLLPDAPGDGCYSKLATDVLLGMLVLFHPLAGIAVGTMLRWVMLGVGLGAILVCDHVVDLCRVIDSSPSTWPWLLPIREIDKTTDTLVPHEFDSTHSIDVLSSHEWSHDIQRALFLLRDLIKAISKPESSGFAELKIKAQKCIDNDWVPNEAMPPPSEETLKRLADVVAFCESKSAVVDITDDHVHDVAEILGYCVLSSRREMCKDDVAW